MTRTVFYSWQSDLDAAVTKSLIQRALDAAVKSLGADAEVDPARRELVVDRDTRGVKGTPHVAETILDKIDAASVFVADLSYVARRENGDGIPNPNVLIEYGWAAGRLGRPLMISVMNTAFGHPEVQPLPFDLRHLRWPILFNCPADADVEQRRVAKADLTKALASALKDILLDPEANLARIAPSEPHPRDVQLLHRVHALLDQSLRHFLHSWNFGTPFERVRLEPIELMNATWTGAAYEFDDGLVQTAFKAMRTAAEAFGELVAERLYAMDRNPKMTWAKTRLDEEQGWQPQSLDAVRRLNALAATLSEAIDAFDRIARTRIRVPTPVGAGTEAQVPQPAADREAIDKALQEMAFAHNRGAFTSIVPPPRVTIQLIPYAALGARHLGSRAASAALRQSVSTSAQGDPDLDSDEWQWWITGPTQKRDAKPLSDCQWRVRVAGGGLLEYQGAVSFPPEAEDAVVQVPGRQIELLILAEAQRLMACALALGLDGPALLWTVIEGAQTLQLIGPGRAGRVFNRPSVVLTPIEIERLSGPFPGAAEEALDVMWRLGGWPEGSPHRSTLAIDR